MTALPWPVAPLDGARLAFRAGVVLVVAGGLVLLGMAGPQVALVQVLALVGVAAAAALPLGLLALRAAGPSRLARTALVTWLGAYAVLVVAELVAAALAAAGGSGRLVGLSLGVPSAFLLAVAAPVAGALVVRAGVLVGWRRWTPLGAALTLVGGMLPAFGLGLPVVPLIVFFPIFLLLVGAALVTAARREAVTDPDQAVD